MDEHYRQPAINVKSYALYPQLDTEVLGEDEVQRIYEDIVEQFWNDAQAIVDEEFPEYDRVYSGGRMGGWLYVRNPGDWHEYVNDTEADGRHPLRRRFGTTNRDSRYYGEHDIAEPADLDAEIKRLEDAEEEGGYVDDRAELLDAYRAMQGRRKWHAFRRVILELKDNAEKQFVAEVEAAVQERKRAQRNNALAAADWRY